VEQNFLILKTAFFRLYAFYCGISPIPVKFSTTPVCKHALSNFHFLFSFFMNRRRFLQISALAGTATALSGNALWAAAEKPVTRLGVQLWSVREDMNKEAASTIQAIAKMGYREVEAFGFQNGKIFGMSLPDFMKLLGANELSMPSIHKSMDSSDYDKAAKDIKDTLKKDIDALVAQGVKYVICPYMNEGDRGNIADMVQLYRATADYCARAGTRFGYHNHDFEYSKKGPDGRLLIEWLLHELDPKKVVMEMDFYWVAYAGFNPTDWFNAYPGRWELCHLKDMSRSQNRETIEFGDGSIDFASILKWQNKAGLRHKFIELEHYKTTPMEGIKKSIDQFKKLRV
jgi:sugar phosphate isomerase/epimerase